MFFIAFATNKKKFKLKLLKYQVFCGHKRPNLKKNNTKKIKFLVSGITKLNNRLLNYDKRLKEFGLIIWTEKRFDY